MLVTGTYENGTVRLSENIHLKHNGIKVTVEIPDDELSDPLDGVADTSVRSMMADIRAIRKTPPGPGRGLSDSELLQDAVVRMNVEQSNRG